MYCVHCVLCTCTLCTVYNDAVILISYYNNYNTVKPAIVDTL